MLQLIAMAPPQGGSGSGSMIQTLIMFGAIFAIFYFMIIRPQQKRAKEREKLISNIQKGDKIITSSGIYGTVAGVEEKTILVQIADNVKVKFDKSAVNIITSSKESE
jgi:preprotein translocase, YajC subunit